MSQKKSLDNWKNENLLQKKYFWVSLTTPLAAAAIITATIAYTGNYNFCGNSECFNNFFNFFKFPIAVAGLSIPATALAASFHRSDQTKHQIRITQDEQRFKNYFIHRDELINFYKSFEFKAVSFNSLELMTAHSAIFGNARKGDYTPSRQAKENLFTLRDNMRKLLTDLKDKRKSHIRETIINRDTKSLSTTLLESGIYTIETNKNPIDIVVTCAHISVLYMFFNESIEISETCSEIQAMSKELADDLMY